MSTDNRLYEIYREHKYTLGYSPRGEVMATGPGLVILKQGGDTPYLFFMDGERFKPQMNDCSLAKNASYVNILHVIGTDQFGTVWNVWIDNRTNAPAKWSESWCKFARLKGRLLSELLHGRPFGDVIQEFNSSTPNQHSPIVGSFQTNRRTQNQR